MVAIPPCTGENDPMGSSIEMSKLSPDPSYMFTMFMWHHQMQHFPLRSMEFYYMTVL